MNQEINSFPIKPSSAPTFIGCWRPSCLWRHSQHLCFRKPVGLAWQVTGCSRRVKYSCLENSMDRGAWWVTVHGVAKSLTWQWHPTPVLLPGKSHGWRTLVGCSPWGRWELDTTERLYFHFSLSCTGEGNDNPLQCSCLENPRDRGAWWAAIYGVAQSRTRLKRLSRATNTRIRLRAGT